MKVSEMRKNGVKDFEVKKYLPIAVVAQIVDNVASACVKANDDARLYCDFVSKKINTDVNFLVHFAGVDFDGENDIADYDWLVEESVLEVFYAKSNVAYVSEIKEMIDSEIAQRIAMDNSVDASIAKAVVHFADALEVLQKKFPTNRQINNIVKNLGEQLKGLENLNVLGAKDAKNKFVKPN